MNRNLIVACLVTLAFLSTGFPLVQAGGTPPTLTWEATVDFAPVGCASDHDSVHSVKTGPDGSIYILCGYNTMALAKYSSEGGELWQKQVTCTMAASCVWIGVAADSAGHVAIAFCDDSVTSRKNFRILDADDGSTLYSFSGTGNFSTSSCGSGGNMPVHMMDTLTLNSTSIQYLVGDSALQYSFVCHWNLASTPCVKQFEVASTDFGPLPVTTGGPYLQAFASWDPSISGGGGQAFRTNLVTGSAQTASGAITGCEAPSSIWYDTAGTSAYLLGTTGCALLTTNRPTYTKLQVSDFSVTTNEQTLTEPIVVSDTVNFNQWVQKASTGFLDGENRGFYCGRAITDASESYSSIVKHNLGTNAQVWNITYNKRNPDSGGSEFLNGCVIDKDGALVVLGGSCTTSTSSGCTFYLRKYAGAGTGRNLQTTIVPAEPVVEEVFAPVDFGSGVANFAADIGFDSEPSLFFFGLILVIIMFLVVAGATKGVSDSERVAGIGGGIAGMGTMVFNTTQELWPAWATVVLIVLTSAVILFFTRSLFTGAGGGE